MIPTGASIRIWTTKGGAGIVMIETEMITNTSAITDVETLIGRT